MRWRAPAKHRLGDVDADHPTALTHRLGKRHGGGTGAAADLEHAFAWYDRRSRQQEIVDRAYTPFDQAAEPNPARAGNGIPIFLLRCVRDPVFGHSKISSNPARLGCGNALSPPSG